MARRGNRRGSKAKSVVGIIALMALILVSGLTLSQIGRAGAPAGLITDTMGAFGRVVTAPVRWVQAGMSGIHSFLGAGPLNAKLKAENAALMQWRDQARAMAERLDAYEKLHSIKSEDLPNGLTGRMIGESASVFSSAGLVNLGARDGVGVNWIALNQNGLVGRVIAVGQNTSRILLLNDGDSRVPVMGEQTRARALASGDKTSAPRLAHLNTPALMQDGERVVTSGDDGIFPRGLAVGQAGIGPDKNWRVRLAHGKEAIDFVRLIPPNSFPAPSDSVSPPSLPAPPLASGAQARATAGQAGVGEVLPLAKGSASVPLAATPEAIRAAQQEAARKNEQDMRAVKALARKLAEERDAARQLARRLEADRSKAPARNAATERTQSPTAGPSGSTVASSDRTSPPASSPAPAPIPAPAESSPSPKPPAEGAT